MALLTNLDCSQPERFRPLELIGMLDGRWAQENSFKAQEQHVDLGWTNGYAHESCAATPVPNPRARELRRRLAHRAGQLRRAMIAASLVKPPPILARRGAEKGGSPSRPSGVIVDSQSVKTREQGGPRGYDGAKHWCGRKRHIVVDTLGLLVWVWVHEANIQDRAAGYTVLSWLSCWSKRLRVVWVDGGYSGALAKWTAQVAGLTVEVVKKRTGVGGSSGGFQVLPKRWVVERTFAWLNRNRRLSKDYERNVVISEGFVYLGMTRLMLRRLASSAA